MREKAFLLPISNNLGKSWKIVFLLCAFFLSGCVSQYLYHPSNEVRATPATIGFAYDPGSLETADGIRLAAWWIPSESPRGTLLFCHGNAGNISDRLDSIRIFHRLALNVLIFDYRGYGNSSGRPSEQGIYKDVEAAWNYLQNIRRIDPQKIVVFGRSFGGAIAAWVTQDHPPGALILEGAFTSLREAARDRLPSFFVHLLVPEQYTTIRYLSRVQCPVLIIHSLDDEVIPFHHGEELFTAAKGIKEFLVIRGPHNTGFLVSRSLYKSAMDSFFSKVLMQKKE